MMVSLARFHHEPLCQVVGNNIQIWMILVHNLLTAAAYFSFSWKFSLTLRHLLVAIVRPEEYFVGVDRLRAYVCLFHLTTQSFIQ